MRTLPQSSMLAALIAVVAVILDQITKYFVVQNIELYGTKPFIPGVMSLYHTRNTGAAFSMFSEHRWVFMVFSVISMAMIVYILWKEYKRHILMNISLGMILGGGIGNMIDRVRLEYVVDFFHTDFVDFAIFNVADCFITVGAVVLAVYLLFFEPKVEKRLAEEQKRAQELSLDTTENEVVTEQKVEENGENG